MIQETNPSMDYVPYSENQYSTAQFATSQIDPDTFMFINYIQSLGIQLNFARQVPD